MHTTKIEGQLEIDHDRGVIYFHAKTGGTTIRISQLPKPIPQDDKLKPLQLDITANGEACSWKAG